MSDDKIESFVRMHDSLEHRRGCMSLFIGGHRFDLTLGEAIILSEQMDKAIHFELDAMYLREKTQDARDMADTDWILKALTEQKGEE